MPATNQTVEQPTLPVGAKNVSLEPTPAALPATRQADSYLSMIERVSTDPAFDVAKFEALLNAREREMRRVAENAFNDAMNRAQGKMRPIAADAENPQTKSKYASYAKLDMAIRPIYSDEGFGISFDTEDSPKGPDWERVLAYVTNAGWSRTYRIDIPADGKGAKGGDVMTKTHAVGAGVSYGMRYLLKMIFNIAVGEDDQDGNQIRPAVVGPTGFENWFLDMDAAVQAGATWKQWSEAWNKSKEEFRVHLAKVNPARIATWKNLAKKNGEAK